MWLLLACLNQENQEPDIVQDKPKEKMVYLGDDEAVENEKPEPINITKFSFLKENPTAFDPISVDFETSDMSPRALRSEYEWSLNGKRLISETSKGLKRTKVKKGDHVSVTVFVRDGDEEASKTIQTTIANSAPQWETDPRLVDQIDGFVVRATDPDREVITYRLEGAPKGMRISPQGRLSYKGTTSEPGGKYNISVIAEDPDKAQVKWEFSIVVSAGSAAQ